MLKSSSNTEKFVDKKSFSFLKEIIVFLQRLSQFYCIHFILLSDKDMQKEKNYSKKRKLRHKTLFRRKDKQKQ